jgi:ribonuclease HI
LTTFDVVAVAGGTNCGVGGTIKTINVQVFHWFFNCGAQTNTKAELLGVWATLTITKLLNLRYIQVIGDSKVIIDWLDQKGKLQAINVEAWKQRTKDLVQFFNGISFHHIFREANMEASKLSKLALSTSKGRITYYN